MSYYHDFRQAVFGKVFLGTTGYRRIYTRRTRGIPTNVAFRCYDKPGGRHNIARVWSEAEPLVMRHDTPIKPFMGDTITPRNRISIISSAASCEPRDS